MLIFVISSGQLSMNSNQNAPTPARSRSQNVCRSPGQQMARRCLVVSPMTSSVSGALSRNHFAGPVVCYMTCCTLKPLVAVSMFFLSLHCNCMTRGSRPNLGGIALPCHGCNWWNLALLWCKRDLRFHRLGEVTSTLLLCVLVHSAEIYGEGTSGDVYLQLAYV